MNYVVHRIIEVRNIVVPHFEAYPLRAKKRRDFAIWRLGAELAYSVKVRRARGLTFSGKGKGGIHPKWTEDEHSRFEDLSRRLGETKKYEEPASGEEVTDA